jgi:hypothetical protein
MCISGSWQVHAPEAGQQQRLEGGRVAGPPGSAAPLLARVQLLCRDMSAAGEQEDTSEFLSGLLAALEAISLFQAGGATELDARSRVRLAC